MKIPRISFNLFNMDHHSATKYALQSFSTDNLGDEIQSIAAHTFLPKVNTFIDRDNLGNAALDTPHKMILNGWYSHRPENWPPSDKIIPLIISFHASRDIARENTLRMPFTDRLKQPDSICYLKAHGPIGVRDDHTGAFLNALGVPSYFSGCLTLTLTPSSTVERLPYVCLSDVDQDIADYVERVSGRMIVRTTHINSNVNDPLKRLGLARDLLSIYASAAFVVTSRLHCALPCLALGTPVLFCPWAEDTYRFSGLFELLRHTSKQDLLNGLAPFDFREPGPNSDKHLALRDVLIARCNSFIRDPS